MAKRLARIHLLAAAVAALGGMLALHAAAAEAALYTVNTTVDARDANPGDGKCETVAGNETCTLRAAVEEANAATEPTTVSLPTGTYVLTQAVGCVFRVSPGVGDYAFWTTPALCVDRDITVVGVGADTTVIDGNQPSGNNGVVAPVMFVGALANVAIRGVTLRRGNHSFGGGIHSAGTLTIDSSVVSDNFSAGPGAGIYNTGTLTVLRSRLERNIATQYGGAIGNFAKGYGWPSGTVRLQDSVIAHNESANGGGVGNFSGTVQISGSTIHGNAAGRGGGIDNGSFNTMTLVNVTVSGNRANTGGGILNNQFATLVLNNVTIANNTARWGSDPTRGVGGGLVNEPGASATVRNSIVAGNFAQEAIGTDCLAGQAPITSGGYNLLFDTRDCPFTGDTTGNLAGLDPLLGTLTDNGGATPTHALAESSPAIDAGNPARPGSGANGCAAFDQLGFLRPVGARCDIGAQERRTDFAIGKIWPGVGGNQGSVTAIVTGSGFATGAAVAMTRSGQQDIGGDFVNVDRGGSAINATFDLTNRATGSWGVVVANPNGSSRTLDPAFTVESGGTPDLWVDVTGLVRRPGNASIVTVHYGNRGRVDALGVTLAITLPDGYRNAIYSAISPPPAQVGQARPDWSLAAVAFKQPGIDGFVQLPLFLPLVPSGFHGSIRLALTLPLDAQDTSLYATIGEASLDPSAKSKFIGDAVAAARSLAQQVFAATVPEALVPQLEQYATTQLDRIVADARSAFAASLGTRPQVYSLAQLQLDLALFAQSLASQAAVPPTAAGRF